MHERLSLEPELPEPRALVSSLHAMLMRRSQESQRLRGRYEIQLGDFAGSAWERQQYGALFVLHTLLTHYALSTNSKIYEVPEDVVDKLALQSEIILGSIASERDANGRIRNGTRFLCQQEYAASGVYEQRVELAERLVTGLVDHLAQPIAEDAYAALCRATAQGAFAEYGDLTA